MVLPGLQRLSQNSGVGDNRPGGPPVDRPGRQAGNGFASEMSTEGAVHQRVSRLQRSFHSSNLSRPDGRAYSLAVLRTLSRVLRRPLESRRHT